MDSIRFISFSFELLVKNIDNYVTSSKDEFYLQYKFAPDLIMLDAYETVESWMTTNKLNPRKLIPAMMRYASEPHTQYGSFICLFSVLFAFKPYQINLSVLF